MPKERVDEKRVTIQFEGWEVDLFICDSGDLGITVTEFGKTHNDDESKMADIFVSKLDVHNISSC